MIKLAAWLIAVGLSMTAAGMAHAQAVQRFDYLVREDMSRGFAGDTAAFERAMALCETRLAEDPNNAEALVVAWHWPFVSCWRSRPHRRSRQGRRAQPDRPRRDGQSRCATPERHQRSDPPRLRDARGRDAYSRCRARAPIF